MNTTKFIIEVLKKGKSIEIEGIGTFYPQDVAAHHDAEKGVFYPDRKSVGFTSETKGDEYVIDAMAKHDCVSRDIAARMWKGYVDALTAKLKEKGSHSFDGLGTLVRCADGYVFTADPGLDLSNSNVRPIDNVKKYDSSNAVDPFAAFEQNMTQVEADEVIPQRPDPVVPDGYVPAQHTESAPVEENHNDEQALSTEAETEEAGADKTVAEGATTEAEPEEVSADKTEPEDATTETEPEGTNTTVVESNTDDNDYPEVELTAAEEENDNQGISNDTTDDDSDDGVVVIRRRKSHTWLWILLLLLLLLLACGAYFYFVYRPAHGGTVESAFNDLKGMITKNEAAPAEEDEAEAVAMPEVPTGRLILDDNAMIYTFSANLIEYSDSDKERDTRAVCQYLNDYVSRYLAQRNYSNAKTPMMDRIASYAKGRFDELYNPDVFYADRFVDRSGDYIHDYIYDELKARREYNSIVKVRGELMDNMLLGRLLDELVEQLGIQPDVRHEVAAAPAVPANVKPKPVAVEPVAQTVKVSKQGYDIVAGFFTNKASANRLANILKKQGCDAYIIDKQGLYFVSMGSAPTQTAAEALFKHIQSWYDGDIVIRKL